MGNSCQFVLNQMLALRQRSWSMGCSEVRLPKVVIYS